MPLAAGCSVPIDVGRGSGPGSAGVPGTDPGQDDFCLLLVIIVVGFAIGEDPGPCEYHVCFFLLLGAGGIQFAMCRCVVAAVSLGRA